MKVVVRRTFVENAAEEDSDLEEAARGSESQAKHLFAWTSQEETLYPKPHIQHFLGPNRQAQTASNWIIMKGFMLGEPAPSKSGMIGA